MKKIHPRHNCRNSGLENLKENWIKDKYDIEQRTTKLYYKIK